MVTLLIDFDTILAIEPGDTANIFWNVDGNGIAAGTPNTTTPMNAAPVAMFPGQQAVAWGVSAWGEAPWAAALGDPVMSVETPPICFGKVQICGQSADKYGNAQTGFGTTAEFFVNSTPQSPATFRRGAWDTGSGQQAFTFTPSPQVG